MKKGEWLHMVEQLQGALNHTSLEADRQEAALASLLAEAPGAKRLEDWTTKLDKAAERLRECEVYVDEAGSQTATAEGELAVHEEQFRQFHKQIEELRQKLANVPGVAIE